MGKKASNRITKKLKKKCKQTRFYLGRKMQTNKVLGRNMQTKF
jgi:hypothetical protein